MTPREERSHGRAAVRDPNASKNWCTRGRSGAATGELGRHAGAGAATATEQHVYYTVDEAWFFWGGDGGGQTEKGAPPGLLDAVACAAARTLVAAATPARHSARVHPIG